MPPFSAPSPTEVAPAESEEGRGILGVKDGFAPKNIEGEGNIKWRKDFLGRLAINSERGVMATRPLDQERRHGCNHAEGPPSLTPQSRLYH